MILNALNQYQTSFRVQSTDGKPAFPALQNVIYGWILEKEKDRRTKIDKKSFFMRCDWQNLFETRSSIGTNTFLCDDYRAWALRYSEQDRDIGKKRYWYTDIGLKEVGKDVIFYARLSYARGQHDLSTREEIPLSTIPRFIRYILQGNFKLYSREPAFRLFDCPVPVNKEGTGKAIAELIISEARYYPLIVFNGGSDILVKEAKTLARELAGKCQVILLGDNAELAEEFRIYLPKELWIGYGKFRVYFRVTALNRNPQRHRFFDIADPEYPNQRHGIINGLLRNHTLEEDGCIQNISEIGRLITLSKLHRFRRENPEKEAEVNEVYALVEQIEKERDDYKQQADYFASEHDAIKAELRREKAKSMHYLPGQQLLDQDRARIKFLDNLSSLPCDLGGTVTCFHNLFPGKLLFADNCKKTANEYSSFTDLNVAWEMLYHLGDTLYKLKFESSESVDLEDCFKDKTGYALGMSEGRQTKRDSHLMALRQISHEGKVYDITPHVKWGTKPPKMLRIHFAFDEELRQIIVGYIGPHMDNATTRTRK